MRPDDYTTKPYGLRELVSPAHALLRRAYGELSAAEAKLLYARDLVLDRKCGQVRCGTEALSLTPTEFRLLIHRRQCLVPDSAPQRGPTTARRFS